MRRPVALRALACALLATVFCLPRAYAALVIGTGAHAVLGHDLTDPEDDGIATPASTGTNFTATFSASEEAALGGGEASFNVFDNHIAPGDDKWCGATPAVGSPAWVRADFAA